VPDLSGLDQNQATAAILNDGLLVGTIGQTTSDTAPAGQVASQNPAANTLVAKGSAVDFLISIGTPAPTVSPSGSGTPTPVPSVVTMPQTQAEQLLTSDGFVVKVKHGTSTLGSGYVYQQDPSSGSAPAGSTITIWVTR
jgi:beta-lactam-binding protein with PASTA domain